MTVPVNPLIGAIVMVDVPVAPAFMLTLVGLAVKEKSVDATLNETETECESEPLEPITATVKAPLDDALHDKVDVPEPDRPVGVRPHVSPEDGETAEERETDPLKPFNELTVIVEDPVPPTAGATLVGLALIVKSLTLKIMVVECDSEPLVPVTVTV